MDKNNLWKGNTQRMINKDPSKRHFYISIVKSIIRIGGCLAVIFSCPHALLVLASAFLAAEILGIVEEL